MINWTLTFGVCALLFSVVAMIISLLALGFVIGLKNSTHKIQWVPVDAPGMGQASSQDPLSPESEVIDVEGEKKKSMNKLFEGMRSMYEEEQ